MSLTVKAYLVKEPAADEIRRFAVDQDVSTSHAYLKEKIVQIFTNLRNKNFDLYWKDADNDMIAFSSDEEQTEALGFVNDGVFKVFIKEKAAEPGAAPDDDKTPHPGVVCDGCESPLCGVRYKCMVCPDYDLCATCEGKGIHVEHNMMRIPTPGLGGWMGFGFHPPPHFPHHPPPPPHGHPHHGPPHHGPPHHGPPHHGPPHHGPPPPFDEETSHDHPPGAFGPFGGPGPFGQWGGRGRGSWRRMMKKCWKKWYDSQDDQTKKEYKEKKQEKDEKKPDKDEKMDDDTKPKSHDDSDSSSDEGDCSPMEDYLKNVGQNVAAMLDPLGIDVEIDVEHGGTRQRFDGPQHPFAQFGWANWGPGRRCGRGRGRGRGRCPHPASSAGRPTQDKEQKAAEPKPAQEKPDVEMDTGESDKNTEAKPVNLTEYIVETPDTETGEAGSGATPKDEQPSPDREWTLLDDQSTPADSSTGAATEGATGIYPEVPQPEIPAPPSDPVIANALDHMKAMGFADDGGWLTTLLQVTKGDINKALDAIRANRNVKK